MLPQSHAYQAQDDRGVYHQIRPRDIPATIAQGKEVYDLTAQAWVNHPTAYASTGGRNPAYTVVEAPGTRGDVLVIDGWRLPQSHAYQAQDDQGVYHQIRPRDIPATIARGKEVYDLTAQAWVNHPTAYASTGGRNPAYSMWEAPRAEAPSTRGDVLVIDGWRLPRSHAYQAQDDQGVYHRLPPRDVPSTIARGKEVYDLTAQTWVNHPTEYASTDGRNPAYMASGFDRSDRGWEQVRGRVERVDRQSLLLRTDDGRRMLVDTSDARLAARLDRGDRVVALGYATGTDRFDARYIGEERRRR